MKLLNDYSHIRGVCHNWDSGDVDQLRRELGYAQRLQINSIRTWTGSIRRRRNEGDGQDAWEKEVQRALESIQCKGWAFHPAPPSSQGGSPRRAGFFPLA